MNWQERGILTKAVPHNRVNRIAVCAVVLLCRVFARSADEKGYMEEDCMGITFHLMQPKKPGRREVVLRLTKPYELFLSPLWVSSKWYDVSGKARSTDAKCQGAAKANIQFRKIKSKHATGSYRIEFSDGRKEEQTFSVKSRRIKPRPICE
jgi:hypothetical protein